MSRFVSVLSVVVLIAAVLLATAAPALANERVEPFQPAPNCENGQDTAWPNTLSGSQEDKHFFQWYGCIVGVPPAQGEEIWCQITPEDPACEHETSS